MRFATVHLLALVFLFSSACSEEETALRGEDFLIQWDLVSNWEERGHSSRIQMTNLGKRDLPAGGWALYFNYARTIFPESVEGEVEITHINGDFYQLVPRRSGQSLPPGQTLAFTFLASDWVLNRTDAPSGFYFTFLDQASPEPVPGVKVGRFEGPEQTSRAPEDQVPVAHPSEIFRQNALLNELPLQEISKVLPTPILSRSGPGILEIDPSFRILYRREVEEEAFFLQRSLQETLDLTLEMELWNDGPAEIETISLEVRNLLVAGAWRTDSSDAYHLRVAPGEGIRIAGTTAAAVFYALQSLRAWLPLDCYREATCPPRIPEVTIEDAPRFPYRGLHLDTARNFHSPETVKKILDLMAFYKLNRFHLHLTDDEGWRLEIPGLPELTRVGARRGHTLTEHDHLVPSYGSGPYPEEGLSPGSGHYSREDFIEILRYAHARHIQVIPELDLPGHSRAAIRAMEARHRRYAQQGDHLEARRYRLSDPDDRSSYQSVQGWNDNVINVCRDSTYDFLRHVIREMTLLYEEAGLELSTLHVGGDEVPQEVWTESPLCETLIASDPDLHSAEDLPRYFLRRLAAILRDEGLAASAWAEMFLPQVEEQEGAPEAQLPLPREAMTAYVWNSVWGWGGESDAYRLANAGFPVVLCNASNLYFDLAYAKHPVEPGYYWAGFVDTKKPWQFMPWNLYRNAERSLMGDELPPQLYADATRLTAAGIEKILGLQGHLWSENLRSPEDLEYALLPKLLGLAERAWAPRPDWAQLLYRDQRTLAMERAWNLFAQQLGRRELPRLDHLEGGFYYRIPPPGLVVRDGSLLANIAFPGLELRYAYGDETPTPLSPRYEGPLPLRDRVSVRAFDSRGRGGRTSRISSP